MRLPLLALVALASASSATAKSWPPPAAGPSVSGAPEVIFTFDDGPNPTNTPKVLDILAKHRIQAVFFLVGEMVDTDNKRVPAIVQRILREGHVIANHTMTHKDLCRVKDPATAAAEIDEGKAAIEKVAGVPLVWFRAPFGVRCDRLDAQLAERATAHFHWDLDPQEWKHKDKAKTVSYLTGAIGRSSARNVILLHDIHGVTAAALPDLIAWIGDENGRREKKGLRPIRIVQAPELAIEQMPAPLSSWFRDTADRVRGLRADLASVLP